jgi:hypothetical protein
VYWTVNWMSSPVGGFSRSLHPFEGKGIVLRDATPQPVERGNSILRFDIAALGAFLQRGRCLSEIP